MIMHDPKKKMAGIMLAKLHDDQHMSDGGAVKNEVEQDVKDSALHSHAEDIMSAIHNKSPQEFVSAMKNFLEEHELHEDQEEEAPSEATPSK